ncbi:hypothetical protein MKK58_18030 [Methylobacterium sp. J-078]|uniref:hypothetical protein n=1 Tax=Methylobacterium sp. J-078 TaxID=2836657 RepID=UPI001FB93BE6|nr:hypothetical protein [Methylobacterium sp. J-078]MCJ2046417.1 hypothetical protein [Methylobacterium sp. J-078]
MANDAFVPLRLSGSPVKTHVDYLRLEDALNALGRQDYAAEWGCLPGWSEMPFRWVSKDQRYVRHELRLMGTRARLRRIPVELALTKAERQACTQLFKEVRTTMREAFETGRLTAQAVHHATGALTPILAPGVWLKQAGPIFFTGRTVIREPGMPDLLADVVIDQADFGRWMKGRGKEHAKTASEAMLRRAGETIGDHKRKLDYGITRDEAFDLIVEAAREHGKEVSERQFKKFVWEERRSKAGRRTKTQKELFTQHRSDLAAQLATLFGKSLTA